MLVHVRGNHPEPEAAMGMRILLVTDVALSHPEERQLAIQCRTETPEGLESLPWCRTARAVDLQSWACKPRLRPPVAHPLLALIQRTDGVISLRLS